MFNTGMQAVGETIDSYITVLRLQAKRCEFTFIESHKLYLE